jgi:spermidine synthase
MQNTKIVYLNLIIISASVICFEIISTRISSVVFVNNYAFIILSLAILGLGCGGIFSYYKINRQNPSELFNVISGTVFLIGLSFSTFIVAVIKLNITEPFIYFLLLFFPFFFAGIVYSQLFKLYAEHSFKLYASDLIGAAIGSIGSIGIFSIFTAPNAILFLTLITFFSALGFLIPGFKKYKLIGFYSIFSLFSVLLLFNGSANILGRVPIGKFSEKDFYYVYPNAASISKIIDSRWSIHGRSDLVAYRDQNEVRQLFIDGAAGTQMYRFGGDIHNFSSLLYNLLMRHTTTIPLLLLQQYEKDNMLVIGPGGGKEVLTGLLDGIKNITGVEVNPDFVDIVKKYSDFDGGIYTNFPNVNILVQEGRHFIKKTNQQFDLVVMALPSTEQLQSIDNFAMNENYLLTVEALKDYLHILTPEGRLVFTVHNRWELIRLIVTTLTAFREEGINYKDAINHFIIIGQDYAPTIVIKKKAFSQSEIVYVKGVISKIPKELPSVTYLPYNLDKAKNTRENQLLKSIGEEGISLKDYIKKDPYDISPVRDDSPYFYKVKRGIPDDYFWLLTGVVFFSFIAVMIPYMVIKKKIKKVERKALLLPLIIFISIGAGFMILEVSLFQKLVLYLGSPTISLSILLGSILIGMGIGSFYGKKIFANNIIKRLGVICAAIVLSGILIFILYPFILNKLLIYNQVLRSVVSFFMIIPFGFLLGIPFPSAIQLLKQKQMEKYIPWMYGVNGVMSVFGSVMAVILAMIWGFTPSFFIGLIFYFTILLIIISKAYTLTAKS